MSYYYAKTVDGDFESIVEKVHAELQKEGFGVLADIDIQGALKKKLGVDFRKYRILGACNPPFALKALESEDKIGTMLPCNVVVQETGDGQVEVAAVNPVQSMIGVGNDDLLDIAKQIGEKLQRVIQAL
ncbi:DUF302 domain-containing protein [Caldithrix abyssi]|uniref:Uncharacterized conserved protein, DUF302 family n=1 Tax=Caldithrix abyssi DSM 13497 TaxID=880073 RepID=H1XVR6_CALAY|nr:DUF302 domain-containing protein [Caldithrix abyssi]APF20897.1 Uncharacterized conserved protein, DUF302 family [Caldithrix abyssi DSM 13497]EHO40643.1 protein of unknown function DUF302 [Caldithrix abyssi DSM 13497]